MRWGQQTDNGTSTELVKLSPQIQEQINDYDCQGKKKK